MARISIHTWRKLLTPVLGVCLFVAGWISVEKPPRPGEPGSTTELVIRPLGSTVSPPGEPLSDLGVREFPLDERSVEVSRRSWEKRVIPSFQEPQTTVRLTPPRGKLQVSTKDGTKVSLKRLPDKEELRRESGLFRLEPGTYEFLAEAEGHLPDRLSVTLTPGEFQDLTVALKAVPKPPSLPSPPRIPARPPSRPSTRPAPPPRYVPPRRPSRPRPQPRFTPVAPPPQPVRPKPVPLFTPLP